jgi:hypothetical protein
MARYRKSKARSPLTIRSNAQLQALLDGTGLTIQVDPEIDKTLPVPGSVQPVPKPKPKRKRRKDMTDEERLEHDLGKSELARCFYTTWLQLGGPNLKTEYVFHSVRLFPFDFAHPPTKCSIEIDGGTYSREKSAHNWGPGITRDCTKQNLAVISGWRTFRLTSDMLAKKQIATHLLPIIEYIRQREAALNRRSSRSA